MNQKELDDRISLFRTEKSILIKSKNRTEEIEKKFAIDKRIVEINKEMNKIRKNFKKERDEKNEKH